MPKLLVPIPEVEDMVTRPVIFDIARQIIKATKLPKDTNVLLPGSEERVPLNKSTIKNDDDVSKFPHSSQLMIEAEETVETDAVLTRAVLRPEHIPCFVDQLIGIVIVPVYAQTLVELNFTQRFPDKATAIRWRNEQRNKISMMRDTILHTATYSYTIPLAYIGILKEIHRLRENQGGYGDTFQEYLNACFSPNVTDITNVGGKVLRKGVRETQQRIQGWFDFESEPEKGSKDGDADAWAISFTYRFYYQKPIACRMTYPIAIHNQMLSLKYRPGREDRPAPHIFDKYQSFAGSIKYINYFESDRDFIRNPQYRGKLIPDFDEFVPKQVEPGTWNLATWMVGLTPDNLFDLINLKDLPKVTMKENVKQFLIESELPFLKVPTKSVFLVQLYEGRYPFGPELIEVLNNGDTRATFNLDIRQNYHLRLGVYHEWWRLDKDALERLRHYPDVLVDLIKYLFPGYNILATDAIRKFLEKFGYDYSDRDKDYGRFTRNELEDILNSLRRGTKPWMEQRQMKTVQTEYIDIVRFKENG